MLKRQLLRALCMHGLKSLDGSSRVDKALELPLRPCAEDVRSTYTGRLKAQSQPAILPSLVCRASCSNTSESAEHLARRGLMSECGVCTYPTVRKSSMFSRHFCANKGRLAATKLAAGGRYVMSQLNHYGYGVLNRTCRLL